MPSLLDDELKKGMRELISTASFMLGFTHKQWTQGERDKIWKVIDQWDCFLKEKVQPPKGAEKCECKHCYQCHPAPGVFTCQKHLITGCQFCKAPEVEKCSGNYCRDELGEDHDVRCPCQCHKPPPSDDAVEKKIKELHTEYMCQLEKGGGSYSVVENLIREMVTLTRRGEE